MRLKITINEGISITNCQMKSIKTWIKNDWNQLETQTSTMCKLRSMT